jgi:hypothetical protein
MNLAHRCFCRSAYLRKALETYILPWVLDGLDIGANVLEVGPGTGVTMDLCEQLAFGPCFRNPSVRAVRKYPARVWFR